MERIAALVRVMKRLDVGAPVPRWFSASTLVFSTKSGATIVGAGFAGQAHELPPLTLADSCPTLGSRVQLCSRERRVDDCTTRKTGSCAAAP